MDLQDQLTISLLIAQEVFLIIQTDSLVDRSVLKQQISHPFMKSWN